LLREGEAVAKELPTAAWAGYARGAFAADLRLIDVPAALALIKDLKNPHEFVRHHGNLAYRLAGAHPPEAERVLDLVRQLTEKGRSERSHHREREAAALTHPLPWLGRDRHAAGRFRRGKPAGSLGLA
jgi:hypothetical protein